MGITILERDDQFFREGDVKWESLLKIAIDAYLKQNKPLLTQVRLFDSFDEHIKDTPDRVVKAFAEYVKGCFIDPAIHLEKVFTSGSYDQMIHVPNIRLVSMCAHHLSPIIGKVHFAYIPNDCIVGLSKIPRFIEVIARRPQVQENLTQQIVDIFQTAIQPEGCAAYVKAYHFCMSSRGVEEPAAFTVTTALRGVFKEQAETRQEFLQALNQTEAIFP